MKMKDEFKRKFAEEVKDYAATIEQLVSGDCKWFYDQYCDDDTDAEEYADSYARLSKYFEDVPDVEIISDMRGNYRGAIIALGLGGPSIYLNTCRGLIEGYWWSDRAEWAVGFQTVAAVDEYFSEQWDISRGY